MTLPRGSSTTPREDAFYFPADHCRHARMWLPWPDASTGQLRGVIAALAGAIAEFEPVALIVNPGDESQARQMCGREIEIVSLPHGSLRLRDTGPTFLVDGKGGSAAIDWRFNGWGERGPTGDATFAHALLGFAEVRRFRAPLTLEASSFVCDGAGTLIALAPAVFDPARNPGLTQLEAFAIFQHWLGVTRVMWLADPHPGDVLCTDIRALAAFAAPGVVLVSGAAPAKTAQALARARDARGETLEIIEMPAPAPLLGEGKAFAGAYTQFLTVNGGVLLPVFDSPTDEVAANLMRALFPDRVVRQIQATALAAAGVSLPSLALPHPARLLERDRATILPRSAWAQPAPDVDGLLQKYIDLAETE